MRQQGLSLIELLVSMFIATIILAGVVSVVQNSRVSYMNEQEASFIQENARYATEMLARDIRMSGSTDCALGQAQGGFAHFANVVQPASAIYEGVFGVTPVEGFRAGVSTFPLAFTGAGVDAASDGLVLRFADVENGMAIQTHNVNGNQFTTDEAHAFSVGDELMVVDANCRNFGLFEVTGVGADTVTHNASGTNCSDQVFPVTESYDCSGTPPSAIFGYRKGSMLMPYRVHSYFVAESNVSPGMPALKRRVLTSAGMRTEELAQGVEIFEVEFGVNTETDRDEPGFGEVNYFVPGNEVVDWETVVAVRYTMILRSQAPVFDENQAVTFGGLAFDDRFLRQRVVSTIKMRNRG